MSDFCDEQIRTSKKKTVTYKKKRVKRLEAENLGLKHELDNYMLRAEEQIELLKAEINRRRAGAEDLYNTIVTQESTISQLRLEVEGLKARIVFEGKHHLEYVKRIRAKWKGAEAERDRY